MTGNLNNFVALEQIADRHRSAERSRLVAAARPPRARVPREPLRLSRSWLGLRRSPKVA